MKIFRIIIGVLLVISGISALFTPAKTFLSLAWIIGVMLIVSGVSSFISYFGERKSKNYSILYLINAIFTFIIGMVLISNAFIYVFTELVLVYIFAAWLTASGVLQMGLALDNKKNKIKWIAIFIAGVINVIIGIYSFFNPLLLALSIGFLMGMWFISLGIGLLTISTAEEEITE